MVFSQPLSSAICVARVAPAIVPLLGAAWLPACSVGRDVLVGRNLERDASSSQGGSPSPPSDSGGLVDATEGAPPEPAEASDGSGAAEAEAGGGCPVEVVQLPIVGGCTADVAKRAFKFAICSCTDLQYSGTLTTSSFTSDTGEELRSGGSVGVNGRYSVAANGSVIGGSLWVQKGGWLSQHRITGALHMAGTFDAENTQIEGDAYLSGNGTGTNVSIGGKLFASEGALLSGFDAAGGIVRQPVTVAAPCDCSAPLDIRAIVDYYAGHHDNAAHGMSEASFTDLPGPTERTLSCGRYYFGRIDPWRNDLTLRIEGHTVIAVDGPIESDALFRITMAPGAELDLFVIGDIDLNGLTEIGNRGRPAATRIYGAGNFKHSSDASLAGNLYFPNGRLEAATRMEIWGSLFVKDLGVSGTLSVHYDQAVLDVSGCAASGRECTGCGQCANPEAACVDGHCTSCRGDGDCCPPLRCELGRCVAGVAIH